DDSRGCPPDVSQFRRTPVANETKGRANALERGCLPFRKVRGLGLRSELSSRLRCDLSGTAATGSLATRFLARSKMMTDSAPPGRGRGERRPVILGMELARANAAEKRRQAQSTAASP